MKISTYKSGTHSGIQLLTSKKRYFVYWDRGLGWGYGIRGGKVNGY